LLDLEDIAELLCRDAVTILDWDQCVSLRARVPLTPIEEKLARALAKGGFDAEAQVRIGKYVVDFLIKSSGKRIVVEADGAAFHNAESDAARDRNLLTLGVDRVVRFTGSQIYRDADECVIHLSDMLGQRENTNNCSSIRRQKLDAAQSIAVKHGTGPIRVLAPAGAGKTYVLVERIVELVERGVKPHRILALAFNKKANEQLVERLLALQVPATDSKLFDQSVAGVRCCTFNAFGYRFQHERLKLNHNVVTSGFEWRRIMEEAMLKAKVSVQGVVQGTDPVGAFLDQRKRASSDLVIQQTCL